MKNKNKDRRENNNIWVKANFILRYENEVKVPGESFIVDKRVGKRMVDTGIAKLSEAPKTTKINMKDFL